MSPEYVICRNGVFVLPDAIVKSLASQSSTGCVYLREDEDTLTISTTKLMDGRRRALQSRFRATMFRDATTLAIVDLKESIRVMAVERRPTSAGRGRSGSPPAAR